MTTRSYMAIVEKEGTGYVALCPELDVASQGDTVESATVNLKEAVELFLECADSTEVERRLHTQVFVTPIRSDLGTVTVPVSDHPEIRIGTLQSIIRQSDVARTAFEV